MEHFFFKIQVLEQQRITQAQIEEQQRYAASEAVEWQRMGQATVLESQRLAAAEALEWQRLKAAQSQVQ